MRKMFLTIFALAFCWAAQIASASGWSDELTIASAMTEDTDTIVVYTTNGSVYAAGCSANNWIISASTDARRGRMYGTVMTALAAGKKIKLWYSDSCGTWGFHLATAILLID